LKIGANRSSVGDRSQRLKRKADDFGRAENRVAPDRDDGVDPPPFGSARRHIAAILDTPEAAVLLPDTDRLDRTVKDGRGRHCTMPPNAL
jgi:hypothetical protein